MSILDAVQTTTHSVDLPSGKSLLVRRFLTKEYKVLSEAIELNTNTGLIATVKSILSACILTEDFEFSSLSMTDVEWLFVKCYALSVTDKLCLNYTCSNIIDDVDENKKPIKVPCGQKFGFTIDTNNITVKDVPDTTIDIEDSGSGITLKAPSWEFWASQVSLKDDTDVTEDDLGFNFVKECVVNIYTKDALYTSVDYTDDELKEFLDKLPVESSTKLQEFFTTLPKIEYSDTIVCLNPKCNNSETIELNGLEDFLI